MSSSHSDQYIDAYMNFMDQSPTSYHAVAVMADELRQTGFHPQKETDPWDVRPGGHYVVRDGAMIAYVIPPQTTSASTAERESVGKHSPKNKNDGGRHTAYRIIGAHPDSPALALKPTPQSTTSDGWGQLAVEVYGGALLNSWLDRELCVAGRVVDEHGAVHLVRTKPIARVPQLAIHLDRKVNEGLELNPQKHIHPIWTVDDDSADIMDVIAESAGLSSKREIFGWDLKLVPTQKAAKIGAQSQFIASGRQDNLSSVFAGFHVLRHLDTDAIPGDDILVFVANDHEEVGSGTRSGAAGPFLEDVLHRTAVALGYGPDDEARMMARSVCISSDAGHSVHPNYAERHDPDTRPMMGRGPMVKINANQRYVSDAVGEAIWQRACEAAGIRHQAFVSHNAMPCGSTIGPITATRLGMVTVDVGIPLLSMHSAREMSHEYDCWALSEAMCALWTMESLEYGQ